MNSFNRLASLGTKPAQCLSTEASRSFQAFAEANNLYGQHRKVLNELMNRMSAEGDSANSVKTAAGWLRSIGLYWGV